MVYFHREIILFFLDLYQRVTKVNVLGSCYQITEVVYGSFFCWKNVTFANHRTDEMIIITFSILNYLLYVCNFLNETFLATHRSL